MKIVSVLLILVGILVTFLSRQIVKRYDLPSKFTCDFKDELTDDELNDYLFNKANVNMKMLGMLIILPGLIIFAIFFR